MKLAIALLFLATSIYAQPFTVGTAAANRGTTAYGTIEVPAASDAATSIPVAVINGTRSGPVVAFVAGSHGTEYASIVALQRLISRIDPKMLAGTAIVVPLVNVASFEQMTVHTNPVDRKSMNGMYPGDPNGTQTQRSLALLADQVVKRANTIVDLHGGDLDEDLVPYSYWMRTGNAQLDAMSRALVLAFGLDRVIVDDVDLTKPSDTRTLSGYALSLGKNVLVAEAGATGKVESQDVEALVDGCLNVLASQHMIERSFTPLDHPLYVGSGTRVRADAPGMWSPSVRGGAYVSEGMRLGTLTDSLGRRIKEVRAPSAGIVTFVRGVPSVWKEATLANVSPVVDVK
ncbi:MAG TPA: succinylglutamate desuccinylase/aspartoacylase family protein [Thermoanaerobaculia bacterium]|nr:succinylglutamate desuccinylase/aspartoacylase family protein [Thermoanaerobaculia bacterium]